ncbi:flagellar basal-body MS-ring/collar protein FliF [Thiomicrorhabdus sp. ZW0627]|uniref:flagellar basal-body MS-ring/collar protein FliF n=1 Tax=Thiomicrorhabdus sp. ZW0627 TaxID=3039774 RepID=UPI00243668FA|nr:flagellar basal-body MS-ring/collar protein FliF [Thiomicrorhabdus sp. ZW0627]MDG6773346.1 flagellar basal-body MS-ring/collar protein FliF [Thiomicrorhabdus sp. ZW0627]
MADPQASFDSSLNPQQATGVGSTLLNNLMALSVAKQVSLVIALAASIALTVGILLWSQNTPYTLLFGSLDAKDINEVVQTLEQEQVEYRIDQSSGGILVPSDQVYALRLKLAAAGFPKQAATGYQLLDVEQGFGISQFKETTQYHRALEGELAKTVSSINAVKSARVMLGLPKRSVFVRKQQKPSASVAVKLYPGRSLNEEQVSSIVYLVASSIPNMDVKDVTVVDQRGNLLTGDAHSSGTMNMSMKQLDYTRTVEETLSNRIIKLLAPIVGGEDKVRAQVTAELDFTQQEQTRENYEPDPEAIRSEQEVKEINRNEGPTGIPGALTNQPPRAGIAPEEGYSAEKDPNLRNSTEKKTKNYELDRTVSHIKNSVGNIHRLSVAVVLDDKTVLDQDDNVVKTALTDDELLRYRRLVSDTVGLDETRGDTLTVVNASFVVAPPEEIEITPIWQENWFWDLVKQLLAGLAVLIIIFGVIRPMLKDLAKKEESILAYPEEVPEEEEEELENVDEISKALEQMSEEVEQTAAESEAESNAEHELLEKVRTMVAADPKVAAHIIKQWMSGNK